MGHVQNAEREGLQKAEWARAKRETVEGISRLVAETNAVVDWDRQLSKGKKYRLEPILTIELERLWMSGRPILFLGAIDDIKTHDAEMYTVTWSQSLDAVLKYMFDTDLHLSLRCNRKEIDAFLAANPKLFENAGFNNVVAVIANITAIRTDRMSKGDEGSKETRVGDGACLRLLYVGDVTLLR